MKKSKVVVAGLVAACLWFLYPTFMFYDSSTVTWWFSKLSPEMQQTYAFNLLRNADESAQKKYAFLEAWLEDLENHRGNFIICDFGALVPITKSGGEPLSEPVGLTAARIIIASRECKAIGHLLTFHRHDAVSTMEIERRLKRMSGLNC